VAYEGFEALRDEEDSEAPVPFRIVEPVDDRQIVITPPPPPPQVKTKRNKKLKHIPLRETRSKAVKPSSNTRSKSKI